MRMKMVCDDRTLREASTAMPICWRPVTTGAGRACSCGTRPFSRRATAGNGISPRKKNAEKLAQGFSTAWKKKVRQLQIPAFALNTKAAWCLRFDDILADALEQGPLQNHEIILSQEVIDHLKAQTPKGFPDTLLPMLMQYYLSHGGETEEWAVLPVSAVDAYYGSTTFSRKKKTLPQEIVDFKEAYGICKFKMTL